MDLTLNLFWSQEIQVAENYGFHLETTTSPNHLVGKPGMFWTCEPKPVLGTEWLWFNHHATGKPEFLQFGSHSQSSATAKLACAKCHIWTFLHGFLFETKMLIQGKTESFLQHRSRLVRTGSVIVCLSGLTCKSIPFKSQSEPSLSLNSFTVFPILYPITFFSAICSWRFCESYCERPNNRSEPWPGIWRFPFFFFQNEKDELQLTAVHKNCNIQIV